MASGLLEDDPTAEPRFQAGRADGKGLAVALQGLLGLPGEVEGVAALQRGLGGDAGVGRRRELRQAEKQKAQSLPAREARWLVLEIDMRADAAE